MHVARGAQWRVDGARAQGVRLRSCRRWTTSSSAAVADTDSPLLATILESSACRLRSWSIRSGAPLTVALAICAAATAATALTPATASSRSLPTSWDWSEASWMAEAGGASGENGVWNGVSTGFCMRGTGVEGVGSTGGLTLVLAFPGGLACGLDLRDWLAATGASALRGAGTSSMPKSCPNAAANISNRNSDANGPSRARFS